MCLKTEDVLFLWNLEKKEYMKPQLIKLFLRQYFPQTLLTPITLFFSVHGETKLYNSLNKISIAVEHRVILLPLCCLSIEVAVALVHSCDLKLEFTINVHVWKFAVRFECIRCRSDSCASTPNSPRSVTQKYHSTGHFTPSVSSFRPFMTTLVTSSSSTWWSTMPSSWLSPSCFSSSATSSTRLTSPSAASSSWWQSSPPETPLST